MRGYIKFIFTLVFLSFGCQYSAYAIEYLEGFPNVKPNRIFSDNSGRFYADYGTYAYIYTNGNFQRVQFKNQFGQMRVTARATGVSSDGKLITHVNAVHTITQTTVVNGKVITTTIVVASGSFVEICTPRCHTTRVSGALADEKFVTDAKGRIFFRTKAGNDSFDHYINGTHVSQPEYESEQSSSMPARVYTNSNGGFLDDSIVFDFDVAGQKVTDSKRIRGSHSIVWDSEGHPHAFFHDPEERVLRHHFYKRGDKSVYTALVDDRESGFENIAFVEGGDIWTIHYFYRTPFSKGLLASKLDNQGRIIEQFVLDASQQKNVGWELAGARGSDGSILLTYIVDKDTGERVYLKLDGTADLRKMAENLATYGHVRGNLFAGDMSPGERLSLGQELSNSYRESFKSYALSVGVGGQYAFWHFSADSDLSYDIENALVNMVEFQGKLFNVDYGVEYAQEVVESQVVSSDASKDAIKYFGAYVGWEKLLYNYDFKLGFEQSSTTVTLKDSTNSTNFKYDMDYVSVKLSLLSHARTQFGIVYQSYNQFRKIAEKEWSSVFGWQTLATGIAEVDVDILAAHYGYTTINYLEKYGVSESRSYFDIEGRLGMVSYTYKGIGTGPWSERPDINNDIMFGTQMEAGWVWFKRWKSLWNLGGYVKVGYRVNFDYFPGGEPGEDENRPNGERGFFLEDAVLLRHGPLVMAAVVF
ncbi:MAG: hypothetical protein OEZ39_08955 [Gammaproteobacteria bacterium]|nr:hypothetical protein [Gammaproteobacteria bacterium]MDH5651993.1 hypothetical protein [Gammaproteobacteria bacterium]